MISALAKLEKKGYLECDKTTRRNLYTARVSEIDYLSGVFINIRDVHDIKPRDIIEKLYKEKNLSEADLMEVRTFINTIIPMTKHD